MQGNVDSRLIIIDMVLEDQNPNPDKVLRDINMLLIGGKERSKSEWRTLLGQAGFEILDFYGLDSANSNIIEAVLKKDCV
jgi:hypothetical protein